MIVQINREVWINTDCIVAIEGERGKFKVIMSVANDENAYAYTVSPDYEEVFWEVLENEGSDW